MMRPHLGILDADFLLANQKKHIQIKASLLKRCLNQIIDYLAILLFSILVGVLLGFVFVLIGKGEWIDNLKNRDINLVIGWSVIFLYYFLGEYFLKGKTLGKFVTKTSVRNISGNNPSIKSILIRSLIRLIPFEFITIIFAAQKRESWHDEFSNTIVVED